MNLSDIELYSVWQNRETKKRCTVTGRNARHEQIRVEYHGTDWTRWVYLEQFLKTFESIKARRESPA